MDICIKHTLLILVLNNFKLQADTIYMMYWTVILFLMVAGPLPQGWLFVVSNVTTLSVPMSTPTASVSTVNPAVNLSPRPVASVESGHPLILTIDISSATSWRLEWSTNETGEVTLGSVKSSQIGACQESTPLSQPCRINVTRVRFSVEHPRHGDDIYCAVIIPGSWSPTRTTLKTSTEVNVLVPVEYVHLQSSSGEITEGQLIVKDGERFTLNCETSFCRPGATIKWMKDHIDVSALADDSTISNSDGLFKTSANLTILAERDSSLIKSVVQCIAFSESSNATSNSTEIITLRIPSQPSAVSPKYIDKGEVRLTWGIDRKSLYRVRFDIGILPDKDGLTVAPYTRQSGGNIPAGVLFSSRITGLQPNVVYNLSVIASNEVGRSAVSSVYITMLSNPESGIPYFYTGVALMAVASLILVTFGVGVAIKLKRGEIPFKLPVVFCSRADREPDPLYEDLENLGKSDAPVIEKRIKNSRKAKGDGKTSLGLVSGVYNSIASSIHVEGGTKKDNAGNIYDDIPVGSALFTSSRAGSTASQVEGKVRLAVPKSEPEDVYATSEKKKPPPIFKKPPSRKYKCTVATIDDETQDLEPGNPPTTMGADGPEIGQLSELKEDEPEKDDSRCEYMDMRVPEQPNETEYVDVQRPRKEPEKDS
ncbi:uncharacterized protein LOC117341074 isoform X2 [Pecten maximus]|uniref:uncharacterized protein LOC117341074 isoform X2 n=1 Tax=Pecten maximus TaxID=6579 RepID=UPI00145889AA|nr:uncharacterized protein LOC117341074 isoform X2 [Pecten maximus]